MVCKLLFVLASIVEACFAAVIDCYVFVDLAAGIKLKMTGCFAASMKEAHLGQCPLGSFAAGTVALLHAKDGDTFMSSIEDNDKLPGGMDAHSAAGVHFGGEG